MTTQTWTEIDYDTMWWLDFRNRSIKGPTLIYDGEPYKPDLSAAAKLEKDKQLLVLAEARRLCCLKEIVFV